MKFPGMITALERQVMFWSELDQSLSLEELIELPDKPLYKLQCGEIS